MQRYASNVQDRAGNALVGASVLITDNLGDPASLYAGASTSSGVLANPIKTNLDGEYAFYAPNGRYGISISVQGFISESLTDLLLYDPSEPYTPIDATIANSAASAFASKQAAADSAAAAAASNAQTALDKIATNADRTQTALDRVSTASDAATTAGDRTAAHSDRLAADAAALQTASDKSATAADRVQTGADAAQTTADAAQTALDRIATGNDRTSTAADAATATTKAADALSSKNSAAISEANASNSATAAAASAASVNDTNLVHKTGDETIAGNKLFSGTTSGITKAMVGLGSVDNTTDANKPVSTAQAAAISASHTGRFYKLDAASVAFTKTGASTLSIKAGTEVVAGGALIKFAIDTAVTMPSLVAGSDYSIWVKPDGTAAAVADSFASPAAAPVAGSVKIGGFHYGLVAPATTVAGGSFATTGTGMIWTQGAVDDIAGINKYSIWDVQWKSAGEQYGFALDPYAQVWAPIYWAGTNHTADGISKYNTDIASGSVPPKKPLAYGGDGTATYAELNWWDATEIAHSHGCRLPTEREFASIAFGVTENQSLGGASVTPPATARQPGYTSRIGLEQATGHIWTWGADASYRNDGTATPAYYDINGGRGQTFLMNSLGLVRVLLGGARDAAAVSGSRASSWGTCPWSSLWGRGVRAVSDHVNTASGAR